MDEARDRLAAGHPHGRAPPAGSAGRPAKGGPLMDQKPAPQRQRISSLGQIGLQQFAPYLMNRIMGRYNAALSEELARHSLTVPQVRALAVLSVVTDGVPINDLAVYTVIGQSTMSRTVDALEAQGLVRRETGERDTRVRKVFLTDSGRAEFGRAWPYLHDAFETMFCGIDDAEYAALVATLNKMLNNVRRHQI
jgi:DNA-binding MarR family transcriptional regulator